MSDDFYASMRAFTSFDQVRDPSVFAVAPADWHVVIADIQGSTKAIAEGRYKDVNMIGGGCIAAVLNALKTLNPPGAEIPYVFGGDGATFAVPDRALAATRDALLGVSGMARDDFGLRLRVGAVPVKDLRAAGAELRVARLALSEGNAIAMFEGGAVEQADGLLKAEEEGAQYRFSIPEGAPEPTADLQGLSCRWEPLAARNGAMVSMLIRALDETEDGRRKTYGEVIDRLADILGRDMAAARPITAGNMRFKWIPKGLRMEARLTRGEGSFLRRYLHLVFESLIQLFLEKFDGKAGGYDAPAYREELRANSDFRRFDDILRFVLDCDPSQATRIEEILSSIRAEGRIAYGIHKADHALMTCLVFSLEQRQHVHFVDGGNGGFTSAAVPLKAQLKEGGL